MMDAAKPNLVLSLFPGVGLLDRAFEEEGFCVVRGPDVLWGGDVRRFHPPAGRFDGVIGGPPCQSFSSTGHLAEWNGKVRFGNLIPEFERCVQEARPAWFCMENVRGAPVPAVPGYGVWSTLLQNRQLGETQSRLRRWSFGVLGTTPIPLRIETQALEPMEFDYACMTSGGFRDRRPRIKARATKLGISSARGRKAFELFRRLQGLPEDFDIPGFTTHGKCLALSNGVPMAMGRAIARAVKRFLGSYGGQK